MICEILFYICVSVKKLNVGKMKKIIALGLLLNLLFVASSVLGQETKMTPKDSGDEVVTKAELMALLKEVMNSKYTTKAFTIDHPVDPVNKVLRHFCMEGPQVWNVYAGNAKLRNGRAIVYLPDYYTKLNKVGSEVYQLTAVGDFANLFVAEKVSDNLFLIKGDKNVEVSWNIKVLRGDKACEEDLEKRPIEQAKQDMSKSQLIFENWQANTKSYDF